MRKLFLFALLLFPAVAGAQGVASPAEVALTTINGVTRPIPSATITVCAANAPGIPCAPALVNTVFANSALSASFPGGNPFTSDANGNYQFFAVPNQYTVCVTGATASGYCYQVTLAPVLSAGFLTLTGGAASHTFATPYLSAPVCTANDTTSAAAVKVSSTTTTVTVTGTAGDSASWHCSLASN